ncbi:PDZ domain-containing protein [Streptomyces sp. NPDC058424]|uniref:PDZ domain-containing protein n=1 Tax=Streptomyces sp. NPDC058424 TaxID=3346491 RepID=UPI00364ED769
MDQTALRPKPMPGQEPGGGVHGPVRRPLAARRRGRRLAALACGLLAAIVLVLSGVGLGTVGLTVIGTSRPAPAEPQRQAGTRGRTDPAPASAPATPPAAPVPVPVPVRPTLGVEVVDDGKPGARVVGIHVPGPGYTAGLIRGDVLLVFGGTRVDTAADLARAVAGSRPGQAVVLTVRHAGGGHQQLTVTPGIVT